MHTFKIVFGFLCFILLVYSCQNRPIRWNGPKLVQPRDQLTVEKLNNDSIFPLIDMSYFAKPNWGLEASHPFSGSISFVDTKLNYPKQRDYYPGENVFPQIHLDFISNGGELIPIQKEIISTRHSSKSLWDVMVGVGEVWREQEDGDWNRASFPLTLTDRYIGQARNCVVTFVYKSDSISNVCLQCSQETADIDDIQIGNIRGTLPTFFQSKQYPDSTNIIDKHRQFTSNLLPVLPLNEIDVNHEVADYFEKSIYTNAPTSLGAILLDGKIYLHPPKTRHGLYPYPNEMRHGLYSVTKSMAGALSLFYFAERYGKGIFDERIIDYVPILENHPGWQEVTFSHTLNMVTGIVGSERAEHLLNILIIPETAEECIKNIASLKDLPEAPGQKFNYASTNLFVLSYALQNYVERKEGKKVYYWDLIRENVLIPIGAENFTLLHTIERDSTKGIPILAYGALPSMDEVAKIALLINNEGEYNGQQILNKEKIREALGRTEWTGYITNNDFRGKNYTHSFWSDRIKTRNCRINASYMLGFGENYVVFLPSKAVILRFLDEHDLKIRKLVKRVENIKSSCQIE